MEWLKAKRERKKKTTLIIILFLWFVGSVILLIDRIVHPYEASIYYEDVDTEWFDASTPEVPMTAKEKLIKEMDERGNQFLNGQEETSENDDVYIP